MNGREIPGFYFDTAKKKYFPIASGASVPANYQYTHANVKNKVLKQESEKREIHRAKRRKKETIVNHHQHNFLSRAYLEREIGIRKPSYYLQRIWPGASVTGCESHVIRKPQSIRFFDRNPISKCLYAVVGENDVQRQMPEDVLDLTAEEIPQFSEHHFDSQQITPESLARMTSPISSLNYLPASGSLVTTSYGSDRPPVVYFTDPERDGPFIGEQFTPKNCSAIWTSSPKPTFSSPNVVPATDTEQVAVGASTGLHLYSRSPAGSWDYNVALRTESDVLAVTWLSPTTICLGNRDGKIRIYDTRSKGSSHILSHPAPITHVRPADDFTRIVCSGVCNTLTLYDMRKARAEASEYHPRRHKKARLKSRMPFRTASAYVARFDYKNEDSFDVGLDVHPRLGLITATDSDRRIEIWNMYTTEVVKSYPKGDWHSGGVRCVRFMDDENGGVSLWANVNGGITKYGW